LPKTASFPAWRAAFAVSVALVAYDVAVPAMPAPAEPVFEPVDGAFVAFAQPSSRGIKETRLSNGIWLNKGLCQLTGVGRLLQGIQVRGLDDTRSPLNHTGGLVERLLRVFEPPKVRVGTGTSFLGGWVVGLENRHKNPQPFFSTRIKKFDIQSWLPMDLRAQRMWWGWRCLGGRRRPCSEPCHGR
jgi:hypothetical protein